MSRLMCQQEGGIHFPCLVLMYEDRIEDSVHAGSVAEYSHRSCPPPYLLESSFNMVGSPYHLAEGRVLKLKTGEEFLDVGKETLHR